MQLQVMTHIESKQKETRGAVPFLKELLWHDLETSLEPKQKSALLGQLGWNQLGQLEEEGSWVACSTSP